MARRRSATGEIRMLEAPAVRRALKASTDAGSMKAFYRDVGMRNPSRSYFIRFRGKLHSLKAVATHAAREVRSTIGSRDFHASDAAARLAELRFDIVHNIDDEDDLRERVWLSRLERPGQAKFRAKLIDTYGGCALSGCTTLSALEAAHVKTVSEEGSDSIRNGILLRADLHKLFDVGLIAINLDNGRVSVSADCEADYGSLLEAAVFNTPPGGPMLADFEARWMAFKEKLQAL